MCQRSPQNRLRQVPLPLHILYPHSCGYLFHGAVASLWRRSPLRGGYVFEVGSNRLIEGFNRPNEVTPSNHSYVRTAASLFQGADRLQLQLHDRVSRDQAATGPNTRSLKGSATLSSLASASSRATHSFPRHASHASTAYSRGSNLGSLAPCHGSTSASHTRSAKRLATPAWQHYTDPISCWQVSHVSHHPRPRARQLGVGLAAGQGPREGPRKTQIFGYLIISSLLQGAALVA